MDNSLQRAFLEVDMVLTNMDPKYVNSIPVSIIKFIKENKLKDFKLEIDVNNLEKQNLQNKTLAILAALNINYWCKDEEKKKELIKKYKKNDVISESMLREKYNPDNIFKQKNYPEQNVDLITTEIKSENNIKNMIMNIIKKISNLFKKKGN